MTEDNWSVVAKAYLRYATPLRPNDEILKIYQDHVGVEAAPVVALGATPLFVNLGGPVWFIDLSEEALQLPVLKGGLHRVINKNWLDAFEEYSQAGAVLGDGSLNSVDSPELAWDLLRLLKRSMRPNSTLCLRVFHRHTFEGERLQQEIKKAALNGRFSELRFLLYGLLAGSDGTVHVRDLDDFVVRLEDHVEEAPKKLEECKAAYFAWRGVSPDNEMSTRAYFPTRAQAESLFASAELYPTTVPAGSFFLAEFAPIFVCCS